MLALVKSNDFMMKLFGIGFLLLSSLGALGQGAPALDIFTSPDGTFQFAYPENYERLVGERILKATQGKHLGIPVCDFSTALVCVIYPIERLDTPGLEGGGFSVGIVPGVTNESDCLAYADRRAQAHGQGFQPSSFGINGRVFRYVFAKRTTAGHSQSADLYRTFQKERCYELRIAVSFSGESTAQQPSSSKSLEDAKTDSVRESLKLILSSLVFR